MLGEHLVHEVECAVARGLRPQDRAAPFAALTSEHPLELVCQLLVLAEEVAYLPGSNADVASRHVLIGADMPVELCHKRLTELHHFIVALASDREVRATLSAAHRQRGERILERLFETEELQDTQVHRRMEAQTTLIGSDSAVELHTVTEVHLYLALVVDPRHTEGDDTLGLYDALDNLRLLELRMLVIHVFDRLQHLSYCL